MPLSLNDLIRIVLSIATAYYHARPVLPPNPMLNLSSRAKLKGILDNSGRSAQRFCISMAILSVILCIADISSILAKNAPAPLRAQPTRGLFMFKTGHLTHLSLTPTQIIAAIMVITGGLLRLEAYKTLGPYFTFQVGIQPNQKLITHGVYAWVRHPSYTGTLLATPGFVLWNVAPGSWVRESGLLDTWVGCVLGYGFAGLRLVMTYMLCFGRPPQEDERLREAFGREWEEWARRVRYRLVPGFY